VRIAPTLKENLALLVAGEALPLSLICAAPAIVALTACRARSWWR
jgi:hypothetical protein